MLIVTKKAIIICQHVPGTVAKKASKDFVRISNSPILRGADPIGRGISKCSNVSASTKPCTSTLTVQKGHSTLAFVEGQPICMQNLSGLTDGTLPGTVKYKVANPGQNFVNCGI